MELNQRKALKEALNLIPTLIDIYDEDISEIDATDAYFVIYSLLKMLDNFVSQHEAREVLDLLTEAKDIAEDESEGLYNKGRLNKRYDDLYSRIDALEARLDNKPLGGD